MCGVTLCLRPDHLELVTEAENTRRRHQRARMPSGSFRTGACRAALRCGVIARVERPTVTRRTLTFEDLVAMLTRFEVLADNPRQSLLVANAGQGMGAERRPRRAVLTAKRSCPCSTLTKGISMADPEHCRAGRTRKPSR